MAQTVTQTVTLSENLDDGDHLCSVNPPSSLGSSIPNGCLSGESRIESVGSLEEIGRTQVQAWENPLMGWTSTRDPYAHVVEEAAKAFAERHGWDYVAIAIEDCFLNEGSKLVVCPAILLYAWAE